jgi:vacuolar-type H+-ATPase subunit I/STV1
MRQKMQKLTKAQEIEKKIKQLKAQHAALKSKENKNERARKTRQTIIIGGWLMANEPEKVNQIIASLTREQDKKAFEN